MNEFSRFEQSHPRRGFTSVEATAFLLREFPDIKSWTCWVPTGAYQRGLVSLAGMSATGTDVTGGWKWTRVPSSYPTPAYWNCADHEPDKPVNWVGMLRVEGARGEDFLLFSYLDSTGSIGRRFMVSTGDREMLNRFAGDVHSHFFPKSDGLVEITVFGGRTIRLDVTDREKPLLSSRILADIKTQVYSFFENPEAYRRLRLRHRRGFLFVGPPGTGKTMTVRYLIRECYRRFKPAINTIVIGRNTDESDMECFFGEVSKQTPGLVILEDMDSLTTESNISRSSFLSQLDGLATTDGLLIIGTTNNPEKIDSALIHRPSRFDRVWQFPLPDHDLRVGYLVQVLEDLDSGVIESLAERTEGWSFAYLNELRTTAGILSLNHGGETITAALAEEAYALLDTQFRAGRKNHVVTGTDAVVGFQLGRG